MADSPAVPGVRLDPVGTLLSAAGLGAIVYGVIRSGTWGFVQPKPDAPQWLGMSPVVWLLLGGGAVLVLFVLWESRRLQRHQGALLDPQMLKVPRLQGGLTAFFFQFMLQAGLFFVIPLFLSVALGLSAVATGVRLLPLSITLWLSAVGVPKLFPHGSPRRIVRVGFGLLFLGIVVLLAALDSGAGADIVTGPLLLAGLGIGTLASQLGAVTVSAVPDSQSGEVGGVQNTVTNLGASIGTALSGAILIAVLTTTFFGSVAVQPGNPEGAGIERAGRIVGRHTLRERRRPLPGPPEGRRPAGGGGRHRGRERAEPDQRAAGRPGCARPHCAHRLGADPTPPDRPTR